MSATPLSKAIAGGAPKIVFLNVHFGDGPHPEPVEIAVVTAEKMGKGFTPIFSHDTFCKPEEARHLSPYTAARLGISRILMESACTAEAARQSISDLIAAEEPVAVVCHTNVLEIRDFTGMATTAGKAAPLWISTERAAIKLWPEWHDHSLAFLGHALGLETLGIAKGTCRSNRSGHQKSAWGEAMGTVALFNHTVATAQERYPDIRSLKGFIKWLEQPDPAIARASVRRLHLEAMGSTTLRAIATTQDPDIKAACLEILRERSLKVAPQTSHELQAR
jgi:hypothetical protein